PRKKAARPGEHSGIDQVFLNFRPAAATASIFGMRGGVAPPYPKEVIWSMPTSSMMTNRILGLPGAGGSRSWDATVELPPSHPESIKAALHAASAAGIFFFIVSPVGSNLECLAAHPT